VADVARSGRCSHHTASARACGPEEPSGEGIPRRRGPELPSGARL